VRLFYVLIRSAALQLACAINPAAQFRVRGGIIERTCIAGYYFHGRREKNLELALRKAKIKPPQPWRDADLADTIARRSAGLDNAEVVHPCFALDYWQLN
jgi:hypothetical protein